MQRPPRNANAQLFGGTTLALALLQGVGVLLVVLGAYAWSVTRLPESEARAFTFVTLVVGNLALIFSNRSRAGSIWKSIRVPNRTLWVVTGLTLGILALTLYLPWLARLFFFGELAIGPLLGAFGLGLASVLWFEAIKLGLRNSHKL
jgi:Ca2+-transporting ATPase